MNLKLKRKSIRRDLLILIVCLSILTACNNSGNNPGKRLSGRIDGIEWEFKYAKSNYNASSGVFDSELFGQGQSEADPCSIFISNQAHLTFQLPTQIGTYQVLSDIHINFEQQGVDSDKFSATSGYVEVISVSGGRVIGYLQATYDDLNSVNGNFIFDTCN